MASQPTLSRFENALDRKQLYRLGEALAECVIERHRRRLHGRARLITIDLDPTDDPTHGAQQLTFFNGHYDTWCYLPVVGFLSFNDEPEQYLATAVLRPGNAVASAGGNRDSGASPGAGVASVSKRACGCGWTADSPIPRCWTSWTSGVEYVVAMAKNAVLNRLAEPEMERGRQLSEQSGQTEHVYGEGRYRGGKLVVGAARDLQGRGGAAKGKSPRITRGSSSPT